MKSTFSPIGKLFTWDDKNITLAGTENELKCLDTLHVLHRSDIDDNILMNLKALDIELEPANITVNGINHIVQKWVFEGVPIGSRFVYYVDEPGYEITDIVKNVSGVTSDGQNKVIIQILPDRFLKVWVDDSSVNIECFKNKLLILSKN
ncbi:hypothetical protein CRE_12667 [Caenorhabditis remanei]|uniref:F-box associated domain-containing protein n=1 Tax=Caenorhabditis remanei TaxID=31234 RepID=E3M773_CAERE|nr:hypothetical protein CRE_12667 [Caenorhabditis remanei]